MANLENETDWRVLAREIQDNTIRSIQSEKLESLFDKIEPRARQWSARVLAELVLQVRKSPPGVQLELVSLSAHLAVALYRSLDIDEKHRAATIRVILQSVRKAPFDARTLESRLPEVALALESDPVEQGAKELAGLLRELYRLETFGERLAGSLGNDGIWEE
jgi:hypothetical protein